MCVWLGGGDSSFLLWRDLCPSSEPVNICRMMHFPSHLYSFPLSSVFYSLLPWSFGSQETIKDLPLIILNFIPFFLPSAFPHFISLPWGSSCTIILNDLLLTPSFAAQGNGKLAPIYEKLWISVSIYSTYMTIFLL